MIIAQTSRYIWEGSVVEFGAAQGGRSWGTTGLVVAACAEPLAPDGEPQHMEFCCNLHTFVELSESFPLPIFTQDKTFFHHYQGSIDFNTVNIHRNVGTYIIFVIFSPHGTFLATIFLHTKST